MDRLIRLTNKRIQQYFPLYYGNANPILWPAHSRYARNKLRLGRVNIISNGGNQAGLWRTLEWSEVQYLLQKRQTPSGARFALGTVNNINGMILLPDDWNTSYYALDGVNVITTSWTENCTYESNVISLSDWTNKLENHGAVFLPAAGERIENKTDYYSQGGPGALGRYWTSTWYASDRAVCLYFMNNSIMMNNFPYVNFGLSVRLVRNVN